jgi:hypothetical protein
MIALFNTDSGVYKGCFINIFKMKKINLTKHFTNDIKADKTPVKLIQVYSFDGNDLKTVSYDYILYHSERDKEPHWIWDWLFNQ